MPNYQNFNSPSYNLLKLFKELEKAGEVCSEYSGSEPFDVLSAKAHINAACLSGGGISAAVQAALDLKQNLGVGGSYYIEVDNFDSLPAAAGNPGFIYVVRHPQGFFFINRKPPGLYRSNGATWDLLADLPDDYFANYAQSATTVNGHPLTGNIVITKSDVGLGDSDNTSDAAKPVSTATQTALNLKVVANGAIAGATKTKITYDAKGLITSGADATTADIADSLNRRYVTDAQQTVIGNTSGTNTGDSVQTTITGNAGSATVLQTARNINGVSFNGSADITVPAAGSTLTDAVPVAKGGTGLTALGTGLQVLRVNSGATALEFGTPAGVGDMLASANLSDVANAATSFANIKQAATTTATGVVELATDGQNAANVVVQGNDARLSDARAPNGAASGVLSGTYPSPGFAVDMATQAELDASAALKTNVAIVPNTAPSSGQILVGNAGGTAYAPVSVSGNATLSSTGALTIAAAAVTLARMANLAQDQFIVRTTASTGVPQTATITAAGRALVDDVDATAQRTTLGLGTLATQSGTFSGTSSGTNTGDQTNITGNAATVTTNANLTGHVTSTGNATLLGSFTLAQLNTAISDADVATGGGTASGTNTGDQTSVSGNAGTATILATARNINGVSFNGSADITVPAAGSTLSDAVPTTKGGTGLTTIGTGLQVLRVNAGATALEYGTPSGTGDMLASANLSDVANAATAFGNIKQAASTTVTGVVELATDGEAAASVVVQGNDSRLSNARTPTAHASTHASAGSDPILLDVLGSPTDVTTLNATTTAHGLLLKATAPAAGLVNYVGIANAETAYTNKALFDTTNPAALGTVGPGTSVIAARRDHIHARQTAIVTSEISNNQITNALAAQMTANTVKVNATASTADATDLTMAASTFLARLAAGNIVAATVAQTKTLLAYVKADVGLTNVTDDVQTKNSIVPNTAPSSGQILVGNAGGTAYAPVAVSSDATLASTGALTIANDAVTYAKIQNVSATDRLLGRSTAGAGDVEEIPLTAAGRALIDDVAASDQRTTLGLGTLATQSGTFSGTSSGTNTGDQTSVTGNAGTATTLATARNINGVSFNGSADITVLPNVTNDAQTKAAIVPNTAPSAGQILVGNAGGTAYAPVSVGTDATLASTGALTIAAASVTLAKLANLAQDQFIGRITASTGVPETATITAAARTVLDDVTVAAMVDTLGGATSTGTGGIARVTNSVFVTPTLGVATATSVNKVTVTAPASSATLTLIDGSSLITDGAFAITLTSTGTTGVTLPTAGTLATLAGTETLSNKRLTPRVQSVANAATITPNADSDDCVDITAIAQAFTIANPSGTPVNFQKLIVRIKDNATARGITFGAGYEAGGVALPTTTVLSKILSLGFIYNTANALNKWQLVASSQET